MIFSCQSCGRSYERDTRGGQDMTELWAKAMGWKSPAGPCSRCAEDPVSKYAWSWSKLQSYELCPEKFRATTVDRTHVEPKTDAMLRGQKVHEAFENAIKNGSGLPASYQSYFPFVQKLRQMGAKAEHKLALSADLTPTSYFGASTWLRVIVDTHVRRGDAIAAVDWKTGRHKPDAFDQLRLIGASLLLANPGVSRVDSRFVWVDEGGEPDCAILNLKSALLVMAEMRERLADMVEAIQEQAYDLRQSWACRFCPVTECSHNRSA